MLKKKIHVNVPFVRNRLDYILWSVINLFAWLLLLGGCVVISILIIASVPK